MALPRGFDSEQTEGSQGATLTHPSLLGMCMTNTKAAINDYIIRDLARTEYKAEEEPIIIACELLGRLEGSAVIDSICMRSLASKPSEAARANASTVQAKVKALNLLQA